MQSYGYMRNVLWFEGLPGILCFSPVKPVELLNAVSHNSVLKARGPIAPRPPSVQAVEMSTDGVQRDENAYVVLLSGE